MVGTHVGVEVVRERVMGTAARQRALIYVLGGTETEPLSAEFGGHAACIVMLPRLPTLVESFYDNNGKAQPQIHGMCAFMFGGLRLGPCECDVFAVRSLMTA